MNYKPKTAKLYNLIWIVNRVTKETIMWQLPIALVKWKKRVLSNTTHTMGKFKIVPNESKNTTNIEIRQRVQVQPKLPF